MNRRGFLLGAIAAVASCALPQIKPAPKVITDDLFIPELWAKECLLILEENMIVANIVYRDFVEKVNVTLPMLISSSAA